MKQSFLLGIICSTFLTVSSHGQAVISGYMTNPAGTDSPYEYIQFVALQDIDFSLTPMAVVVANNGSATSNGWVAGGGLTYEFSLTSGTVSAGHVFYVGGSGELINGSGSASLSGETWIRAINTGTTGGDLFGSSASAGVVGNGGSNADGIGLFNTTNLTATTVPIDAVFYGSAIGTATNSSSQTYTLPVNDLYNGGYLQATNTILFDPSGGVYAQLVGTYDTNSGTWITPRTANQMTSPTSVSEISSQITVVPEPSILALSGLGGLLALLQIRRRNN